jgi:hypothetical protein
VWEVLDGGLKRKIEIQWSDICGIKMFCPENENGTLEIAVRRFKYYKIISYLISIICVRKFDFF